MPLHTSSVNSNSNRDTLHPLDDIVPVGQKTGHCLNVEQNEFAMKP